MTEFFMPGDWRSAILAIAAMAFIATSVVLIVTLATARAFRGRGATVRSAILRGGLAAMVICPAASLVLRRAGVPGLKVIPRVETAPASVSTAVSVAVQDGPLVHHHAFDRPSTMTKISDVGPANIVSHAPPTIVPSVAHAAPDKTPMPEVSQPVSRKALVESTLTALWFVGTALLLARLLIANVLVARMRRRAWPASLETQTKCETIARQLGVRAPSVLIATGISGPCLVGWLRPAILLAGDGVDVDREILIHELAHVKRHDCAWQLLAKLAVALVWFQPLMWIWAREMERSAEEACDDAVLARDGDRTGYARRLAGLAEMAQRRWMTANAGVGVVGMKSSVGRRIARLLNTTNLASTYLGRGARSGIAVGAVLLGMILGAIRPAALSQARADEPKKADAIATRHHGRVVDAEGKPVKDAKVFVEKWKIGPVVVDSAKTDVDGGFDVNYETSSKPSDRIEIQVFAAGKGIGTSGFKSSDEIHLVPATRITLTLLGPDSKPVAGMRVFPTNFVSSMAPDPIGGPSGFMFFQPPPEFSQTMSATTDADGKVTLADLPRGTKVDLEFDDDRFAKMDVNHRIRLSDDDAVTAPATIHLELGGTFAGVVRFGPTGKPAAGIVVGAQSTNESHLNGGGMATTDEQGRFAIKHLQAGEYNVELYMDQAMRSDWTAVAHEGVTAKAGQKLTDLDFSLIKGNFITGKVTVDDTGEPVTDAQVGVYGPAFPHSSAGVQATTTNADGSYTLRVPAGGQYVYVMGTPAGYKSDWKKNTTEIEMKEGKDAVVDFKLSRAPGVKVGGIVIGLDGKPAAGITVQAEDGSGIHGGVMAMTDAQGRFHFEAVAMGTPIVVKDGERGVAEPVKVEKGKGDITLQLVRRSKTAVHGLITNEQGKPIEGANIRLSISVGNGGSTLGDPVITGKDGRYQFNGLYLDSRYHIAVDGDGYGEVQMPVKPDQNKPELPTLKLPKADGIIHGIVVSQEGKPVEGVKVTMNNGMHPKTAISDPQGRFSFRIVAGTQHLLWIAMKKQDVLGPHAIGAGGPDDIKLWLPEEGKAALAP